MSDNKLKIRIQIQQPKVSEIEGETDVTDTSIPDLDTQAVMEKPPFDWRKIALALFFLLAIIGLIGYLFFGRGDNETLAITEETYSGAERAADITARFNYFGDNDAAKSAPFQQPEKVENDLSAKRDETVTAENADKEKFSRASVITPRSKPSLSQIRNLPLPELKPETVIAEQQIAPQSSDLEKAVLPVKTDTDDQSNVTRAQLTHAVKHREPIDEVSEVQLEPGERINIYFFAELNGLAGQHVSVNWYFKDRLVTATKLRVGGKNWRTYASKLFNQKSIGQWRAVLVDGAGNQLAERHFVVSSQM